MNIATKYNLQETAKKTAVSNELQVKKVDRKNFLFDFKSLKNIDAYYKEKIIKQVLNDTSSIINDYHFININKDNFSCITGHLHIKRLTVYNKDGKQLYIIFDVAYADLKVMTRSSIYNEYDIKDDIQVKIYNNTQIETIDLIKTI